MGIVRVGSTSLVAEGPQPEWDVFDAASIPGTSKIAEIANRSAPPRLWLVDRTETEAPKMIATEWEGQEAAIGAIASPAGDRLALSYKAGITVLSLSDEAIHAISGAGDSQPTFRRDGKELYFTRAPEGATPHVMAIAVDDGGQARVLVDAASSQPAASPRDDAFVYLEGARAVDVVPMLVERPGAHARPLSPALESGRWTGPRFSPDGKRVAVIRGGHAVVEVDVTTGKVLHVADAQQSQVLSVFYQGDDLFAVRGVWMGDIWMADDPL
jgi:dipeptidyl aminopeptidase/acylaminoacyl peptidase